MLMICQLMNRAFLMSCCLIGLFCSCGPLTQHPATTSEIGYQGVQPQTALEKRLIVHIKTKGMGIAKPIIEALEAYRQKHKTYPTTLAELEQKDLITHFDVRDFIDAKQPSILSSVESVDGPRLYELNYSFLGPDSFSLGFRYSVYGMTGLSYESSTGAWNQDTTYF